MSGWAAKRFWTNVDVIEADGGFGVTLDTRRVMTPGKQALTLPTRAVATQVADEWDAVEGHIDPAAMPWTRSANSAVEKVAPQMAEVRAHLLDYAETDLLSYRAERPKELVARQAKAWDGLLDWADATFGARLAVTRGVMPVAQDADALEHLAKAASAFNAFELTGFYDLVTLSGSFVLGLRAAHFPGESADIWRASRVDHDFQAEEWGRDEDAAADADAKRSAFLHGVSFLQASQSRD